MTAGGDRQSPQQAPDPLLVLALAVVIYGALAAAALLWLWCRDRTGAVAEQSVGRLGPLAASGAGLAVALVGVAVHGWLREVVPGGSPLHTAAAQLFVRWDERVGIAFSVLAALAEELFFRLAVQDAFGLAGSVTAYVLLNIRTVGLRWSAVTLVHALCLGGLVELGFGLLGSTSAHAVLNYLSLRRIHRSS